MCKNDITVEDCVILRERFIKYTDTAEQHEFPMLFAIHQMLDATIEKIKIHGITDQKDMRAMFRVVLKTIGEDYSAYLETN